MYMDKRKQKETKLMNATMMNDAARAREAQQPKLVEMGKDYGFCFGLEKEHGQHLVYLGDNRWECTGNSKTEIHERPDLVLSAYLYMNGLSKDFAENLKGRKLDK